MQQVSPMATRYDGPTIWFHWTVACLVLVQWLLAQVIDWFPLERSPINLYHIRRP